MSLYVHSAEAISPLPLFQEEGLESIPSAAGLPEEAWFSSIHPDYKLFIPPAALRRMSPVIRMGLAASRSCMEKACMERPDAIVIGSGLGCVKDTVKFLGQVIEQDEQLLNPTAFIQSTHNTVSGQIALAMKCHGHNLTFSQKGLSFENALLDALMLAEEDARKSVLLGGVDEVVEESYRLMEAADCVRDARVTKLMECRDPGFVAGEGAAFFLVSASAALSSSRAQTCIEDVGMYKLSKDSSPGREKLQGFLEKNSLGFSDIALVMSGRDGDLRSLKGYQDLESCFPKAVRAAYKHLTGSFDTASALGTFLTVRVLETQEVPAALVLEDSPHQRLPATGKALVVNLKGNDLSFILLSRP